MKQSRNLKLMVITALLCSAGTVSIASNTGIGEAKEASMKHSSWLDRTTISTTFQKENTNSELCDGAYRNPNPEPDSSHKVGLSIETLQPITHFDNMSKDVVFVQGKLARNAGKMYSDNQYWNYSDGGRVHSDEYRYTSSSVGSIGTIGVGYRRLSPGEHSYVGINTFYDYTFKEKHRRMSVGLEYVAGENTLYANMYKSLSDSKQLYRTYWSGNEPFLFGQSDYDVSVWHGAREAVFSGYDIGYSRTFKHARWIEPHINWYHMKIHDSAVTRLHYIMLQNKGTINGTTIGSKIQITPHISVDIGYEKASNHPGQGYAQIMYTLGKKDYALFGAKRGDDTITTARSKMLENVHRKDIIVQQQSAEEHSHIAHNQL